MPIVDRVSPVDRRHRVSPDMPPNLPSEVTP